MTHMTLHCSLEIKSTFPHNPFEDEASSIFIVFQFNFPLNFSPDFFRLIDLFVTHVFSILL